MKERSLPLPGGCWKVRCIRLHQVREAPMETAYDGRQVVGMDLHRRRSVLVRMTGDGTVALSRYMIMALQIFLSGVGTKPVRQAESGIWWPSSTRRR
jgi:hypothetical protein